MMKSRIEIELSIRGVCFFIIFRVNVIFNFVYSWLFVFLSLSVKKGDFYYSKIIKILKDFLNIIYKDI